MFLVHVLTIEVQVIRGEVKGTLNRTCDKLVHLTSGIAISRYPIGLYHKVFGHPTRVGNYNDEKSTTRAYYLPRYRHLTE